MRLLSVDWDYFFPDTAPFDWGHIENQFLMAMIWPLRVDGRNMVTGAGALEEMMPDEEKLGGFWERHIIERPTALVIAESHSSMYNILNDIAVPGNGAEVVNFDQHHDIYYGSYNAEEVDCSDWVAHGFEEKLIEHYTLVYPEWVTEEMLRARPHDYDDKVTVTQQEPEAQNYDIVFVCRSGAWTPTWADHKWLEFIHWWKDLDPDLWDGRFYNDFAETQREPTLEQAHHLREESRKQWEELDRRKKQGG